jgi:hypothetical protein
MRHLLGDVKCAGAPAGDPDARSGGLLGRLQPRRLTLLGEDPLGEVHSLAPKEVQPPDAGTCSVNFSQSVTLGLTRERWLTGMRRRKVTNEFGEELAKCRGLLTWLAPAEEEQGRWFEYALRHTIALRDSWLHRSRVRTPPNHAHNMQRVRRHSKQPSGLPARTLHCPRPPARVTGGGDRRGSACRGRYEA